MTRASVELRALLGEDVGPSYDEVFEELRKRVIVLNARVWENRIDWDLVQRWLANFTGRTGKDVAEERLNALFLLAQFLYFGSVEIRVLLRAVYRDLFLVPAIQQVRSLYGGTRDAAIIRRGLISLQATTRFLGVGSPSESGVHLLYYFRQENRLHKGQFIDTAQILERASSSGSGRSLRYPGVTRYVFVDDVCGSGDTAQRYSRDFLEEVSHLDPSISFSYLAMFGRSDGLDSIRNHTVFGTNVAAVFELDETYRCLSPTSRYLRVVPPHIDPDTVRLLARVYGETLLPGHGGGFEDSQMLMGFHHNTPDNTLPIMWMDQENDSPIPWCAVFRRYPKI